MKVSRLEFIDALRGLAAVSVLVFHLEFITRPRVTVPDWLIPLAHFGSSGVTLFFVVSAFTLCVSMDSRGSTESRPVLNFLLRRFFRIAPLFYLWILLTLVRDAVVFGKIHSAAEVAQSLSFTLNLVPGGEEGFVWASWTLGVEMLLYIFFPLMFRATASLGRAIAFFGATLLLRSVWHDVVPLIVSDAAAAARFYNFSLLRHLPTFALGFVAYRAVRVLSGRNSGDWLGPMLTISAAGGGLALAYGLLRMPSADGSLLAVAGVCAVLVVGLALWPTPVLVNRVMCFLGRISYSIYLAHATVLFFLSHTFARIQVMAESETAGYLVCVLLGTFVVTVFALVTYRLFEEPGNRLGRALVRFLEPQGKPALSR